MMKSEQLRMIDNLEQRLIDALEDLAKLKASLLDIKSSTENKIPEDVSLEDVYLAIGKKKKAYAYRLKAFCNDNNINTLAELVSVPPSQFIHSKGVGITTLHVVRKAIESLGVVWTDAQ